jgi:hypothetical protein
LNTTAYSQAQEGTEFLPRRSTGRLWAGGTGVITLALFVVPMILARDELPWIAVVLLAALGLVVTTPLLLVAYTMPNMRYLVTDDELIFEMRPLIDDRVPIERIRTIQRRNLKVSLLASFRFPGLAVFDVDYRDAGRVRMCATAAATDILLIDTGVRRYGITPEDEGRFIRELIRRSQGVIEVLPPESGRGAQPR